MRVREAWVWVREADERHSGNLRVSEVREVGECG